MKTVSTNEFDFVSGVKIRKAYGKTSSLDGKLFLLPSSLKKAFSMKSEKTGKVSVWVFEFEFQNVEYYTPIWSSLRQNPGLSGWKLCLTKDQ